MVGQTLGHYRILTQLGAGGMGVVYRARDENLERDVALKVLPAGAFADETARARFRKEALALSQLNHPHICTIYDVGEANGQAYIAMEYVEGRPLSSLVPHDGMPLENVVRYGAQIAAALQHAHDRGVVHRDLKSSNVIVTPDGRAKVLDFGLARRLEESKAGEATRSQGSMTQAGSVMGTLHYMAPEVLRGEPADARSDLWALGVVVYEMASGETPFQGQTGFANSSAIRKEAPKPLPPPVPPVRWTVIQRCLAKEPGERYQRASEVQAALDAVHSSGPMPVVPSQRRWIAMAAVLTLLAAVSAGGWVWGSRAASGPPQIGSIAVLPLDNLSGDPSQEYFADGMTETLIAQLAKIGSLRVISRTSVMKYKGAHKPSLPEIARELNVDAVVEGSVQRSGSRVRVTAQLIQARNDLHLWAEQYERDISDALLIESEVARAIAGEIKLKLTPQQEQRLARARRVNPEAYDYYLRGKSGIYLENDASNQTAIGLLERAVLLDPNFADAYAGLATACAFRAFLFAPKEQRWEEKAEAAIQKALSLEPDSAEAHFARPRLLWTPSHGFQHEDSIRECRRALTLNPNQDEAHFQLALIYIHIGLFDQALREAQAAASINPLNPAPRYRIGEAMMYQGQFEEALAAFNDTPRDFNPSVKSSQTAWALFSLGRKQEAAARIEEGLKVHPEDTAGAFASIQSLLYAAAGDRRRAEESIRRAEARKGFGHFHHTAYQIASAYAVMNKPEPAIRWLETAADTGFPCYPLYQRDRNLDSLRKDPRFAALLAKLKQQWEHYKSVAG